MVLVFTGSPREVAQTRQQLYKQKQDTKERNPRCFLNEHKCVLHSRYGGEPHSAQTMITKHKRQADGNRNQNNKRKEHTNG